MYSDFKNCISSIEQTHTGFFLHQAPVLSFKYLSGFQVLMHLLEHPTLALLACLGPSSMSDLDLSKKLCPLWGSVSTASGDCGSRGGGNEHQGARESCKGRSNRWRSSSPSLKRILIKVPEIATQNKQLWEPDPQGIAQPPRAAGC